MDDLISRKDVLDAFLNVLGIKDPYWFPTQTERDVYEALKKVPSAQPEIIRCKDCKHRYLENDIWVCPFGLPGGPEFFCGYGAKMEVEHD